VEASEGCKSYPRVLLGFEEESATRRTIATRDLSENNAVGENGRYVPSRPRLNTVRVGRAHPPTAVLVGEDAIPSEDLSHYPKA